ncbi:MAG TPA: winged helix DNA-binding protein [Alphaproteobacteria bacterium]|nr:winged helix DNA-binding protein [Alphaproteobacteria bacterium]
MSAYYETIHIIERLHRQSLDVLKIELDRLGIEDINNVQALILYNIGADHLTVGELTLRGYYLGSNVSYNLKKMVENGYLVQERSLHDRRSVRVKVSEKGGKLKKHLDELFERHAKQLERAGLTQADLTKLGETMHKLERFWSLQTEPHLMALTAA